MLKFQYKNAEDIPEGLEEFYKEQEDGTFILKVEGAVDRTRLDEFRENNKTLIDELDSTKASLSTMEGDFSSFKKNVDEKYGDIDLTAYQEMISKQKALRDQILIDEGKHKELLALREDELRMEFSTNQNKRKEEANALKAANEAEMAELTNQLSILLIDNKLTALAAQYGVRNTALPDILARGKGTWRLEGGDAVAYDGNGNKMYNADGVSLLDINTWMESLSETAPHLFEASSGSGDDLNIDEWLKDDDDPDPDTPDYHNEPGQEFMVGPLADIRAGLDQL